MERTHRNVAQLHGDDHVEEGGKVEAGVVEVVVEAEGHHLADELEVAEDEQAEQVERPQAEAEGLPEVLRTDAVRRRGGVHHRRFKS